MKISTQQYAQTLLELTEDRSEQEIAGVMKKFAEVLKRDGQMKNSKKIIEKFSELYDRKNGIVEAEITTRYKIQDTITKQIKDFIGKKYSAKEVVLKNTVDGKIKGGIMIRIGDEILDASISNQLKRLRNILIK